MKDKGERERYTHLNTELQRISRRNKKDLLNEKCKEVEIKKKEWESLEISSRKLEIVRETLVQGKAQ